MVAREASRLPSAARAPRQSEKIEVPDLSDCVLGEVGVPEVHRVGLQSLVGCSLCRGLLLKMGVVAERPSPRNKEPTTALL